MFETRKNHLWVLVVLVAAGCTTFAIYSFAQGMAWQFDDYNNLKGLASASSPEGIYSFVFGGGAGPLGRPVALLSFLPDYGSWPNKPWGIAKGNVVWHSLNGLLVFLFINKIFCVYVSEKRAMLMAAFAAFLWLVLPMHASAILMPVQRMTLVSSFWVLCGLVSFSYLRTAYAGCKGVSAIIIIIFVVAFLGILAIYSKEMGALLVLYIAVTELVIFRRMPAPGNNKLWRIGVWAGLFFMPLIMLGYTLFNIDAIIARYEFGRPYSLTERLATQSVILWEYLANFLFPRYTDMGPYHDDHAIYTWHNWQPWISICGWLLAVGCAAIFMRAGLLARLTGWSLFFYLSGHLIESTWFPLELYFEHRNYLAFVGLSALFIAVCFSLSRVKKTWVFASLILVFLVNIFSLQQLVSLWGRPLVAAEMWYRYKPDSARAVQTLSHEYVKVGFVPAGVKVLDGFSERHPGSVSVQIQALIIQCRIGENEGVAERLSQLKEAVYKVTNPLNAISGLSGLGGLMRGGGCGEADKVMYDDFIDAALHSPSIKNTRKVRHHYHYEKALNALSLEKRIEYVFWAKKAFFDFPSVSVAEKIAAAYFANKEFAEALLWLDQAESVLPNSIGVGRLESMRQAILMVKKSNDKL